MFGIISASISQRNAQEQFNADMHRRMQNAQAARFQKVYGERFAGIDYTTGMPIVWGPTNIPLVVDKKPNRNY